MKRKREETEEDESEVEGDRKGKGVRRLTEEEREDAAWKVRAEKRMGDLVSIGQVQMAQMGRMEKMLEEVGRRLEGVERGLVELKDSFETESGSENGEEDAKGSDEEEEEEVREQAERGAGTEEKERETEAEEKEKETEAEEKAEDGTGMQVDKESEKEGEK